MKKYILNKLRKSIKKQYPNYSNDKLDEIMYGLEGVYLTIEKAIIIFAIAIITGMVKELLSKYIQKIILLRMFQFKRKMLMVKVYMKLSMVNS